MKKFTKFLMFLLVAVLGLFAFACKKDTDKPDDGEETKPEIPAELKNAIDYVDALYRDKAGVTTADWAVIAKSTGLDVAWSVTVTKGQASDVVVTVSEDGNTYIVDVNEKSSTEIAYTLKATITLDGKTVTKEYNFTVPAFKELSYAEFIDAAKGDVVTVKGIVTAVIGKAKGNTTNCLYFQDADGAYYAYGLSTDPSAEGENQVAVGMEVRVTGTKDIYSGTLEVANCSYEILNKETTTVVAADYTAAFTAAQSLKDEALVAKQGLLVTIKGVSLSVETDDDLASGYYKFKLGSLESYIRISSSVCPLTKADQTTFIASHKAGYTADATGIVCVYDGQFYLTPVTADAFSNLQLPALSDAEAVAYEKSALLAPVTAVEDDTVVELQTAGVAYSEQVAIAWTSDNACAVVAEDGKSVTFTLPEEACTVTLTATLTAGDVTDTVTFEVAVDAAPTVEYVATKVLVASEGTFKLGLDLTGLEDPKTLYATGTINSKGALETTEKLAKAADFVLAAVEGKANTYTIKVGEQYLVAYRAGNYNNMKLDTEAGEWVFDATLGVLTATVSYEKDGSTVNDVVYFGTYLKSGVPGDTMSLSLTSYISGDNASKVGVSQFPGYLYTLEDGGTTPTPQPQPEEVKSAFTDEKYEGELELLAADFVKDFNATTGKSIGTASQVDTNYIDSGDIVTFFNNEAMQNKWMWLFEALSAQFEDDSHDPNAVDFDMANHKPFYIANICGFLTATEHKDTWFEYTSMDFADEATFKAVMDKYLFGSLIAKLDAELTADYNATTGTEFASMADLDTDNCSSGTIETFFADETMAAKWAWLKVAVLAVSGETETTKGLLFANINAAFTFGLHTDTWLEVESADFRDLNNVRTFFNIYIEANPDLNDVAWAVTDSTEFLVVTAKAEGLEAGDLVTFGKARYIVGTNAFATLEAALAVANADSTIKVAAGTYAGATIATEGITIEGPNALQNPNFGPRAEEAIFTSDLVIGASNITLKGIELTGAARVYAVGAEFSNLTVEKVFFKAPSVNGGNTNNTAPIHLYAAAGKALTNVVIKDCRFESATAGVESDRPMIMMYSDIENLTVVGNVFDVKGNNYNDGMKIDSDNAAFGVKGNVTISDNVFKNFQQYTIWMRKYGAGTYTITNNKFENIGLTAASHGMATFVTYTGTTEDEFKLNMSYNTMEGCMILLRIDAAKLPETAELKALYNVVIDHKGDYFIKNTNESNPVDASYGYWAAGAADASKMMNATYENAYTDATEVPVIGDADVDANSYTINFDLNGGEWFEEDEVTYVYGNELEIPAPEKEGFTFVAWKDANGQLFTSFPASLKQNLELTAVWAKAE